MAYKRISPVPIIEGGTNAVTMATTDGVVFFDGTRLVTTAVGSATQVLTSNGAGVAPTFQAAGGGGAFLTWNIVTGATQAAVKSNAYVANNAGTCVITLPATAAVGDTILISGMNNVTGWQIAQNSGQLIHYGVSTTTTGAGGSLASTSTYDTIWLTCIVTNTTWLGYSTQGNITVV
jgi:transcription elongation factor